jgi:hypothetical protein
LNCRRVPLHGARVTSAAPYRMTAGAWAQHGFMDKKRRDERGIPIDYARFYFMDEAVAEAFKRRWMR